MPNIHLGFNASLDSSFFQISRLRDKNKAEAKPEVEVEVEAEPEAKPEAKMVEEDMEMPWWCGSA